MTQLGIVRIGVLALGIVMYLRICLILVSRMLSVHTVVKWHIKLVDSFYFVFCRPQGGYEVLQRMCAF